MELANQVAPSGQLPRQVIIIQHGSTHRITGEAVMIPYIVSCSGMGPSAFHAISVDEMSYDSTPLPEGEQLRGEHPGPSPSGESLLVFKL